MRTLIHSSAVVGLLTSLGTAFAGPNSHGTLIVHANPPDQFSSCANEHEGSFCSLTDPCVALDACEHAITRVDASGAQVWTVIAAFPGGTSPRLSGITFGVQYPTSLTVEAVERCADFELSDATWPESGSGTALTWNTAQTDPLRVIYAFAGYNYGSPALFSLIPHPTQGGFFGDDSIPSLLDPIAGYGALGFARPGVLACPSTDPLSGACCLAAGLCVVRLESDCLDEGGIFQGEGIACNDVLCPRREGACCVSGQVCHVMLEEDCLAGGGSYQGDGTDCSPDPCAGVEPEGACCLFNGTCIIGTEVYCEGQGGNWQGEGTSCDPHPCDPSGACCLDSGACRIFTEQWCGAYFGVWQGAGSSCDVVDCAVDLPGACCVPNGSCLIRYADECVTLNGTFQGEGTDCTPYPCPRVGACCLTWGCAQLPQTTCESEGGDWLGPDTQCDPYPCPGPEGVCCIGTDCEILLPPLCQELGGVFYGPGIPCDPWICGGGGLPVGACCAGIHCFVVTDEECAAGGGSYLGDNTSCDPNPCLPVPIRSSTWGGIKARYR